MDTEDQPNVRKEDRSTMWTKILAKYFDYLSLETDRSSYSIKDYKVKLRFISTQIPYPFTLDDARGLLIYYKKKNTEPSYIHYIITLLNSFIRYCKIEKEPQLDLSEVLNKLRPKLDRTPDPNDLLSVEEVSKIITTPINRPKQNPLNDLRMKQVDIKWNLFLSLCYKTASRSGEIAKVKKRDINFTNHSLTFYETKTGGKRVVAIPPDMEDDLKSYLLPLKDSEYLFTSTSGSKAGQPISQEMANKILKNRARYAGIERRVHVHMLRHSAITHMLIRGAPMSVVQALCGHKRLATTQLYTHILVDNQREAMIKYNPLIKKTIDPSLIVLKIKDFLKELKLQEYTQMNFSLTELNNELQFSLKY